VQEIVPLIFFWFISWNIYKISPCLTITKISPKNSLNWFIFIILLKFQHEIHYQTSQCWIFYVVLKCSSRVNKFINVNSQYAPWTFSNVTSNMGFLFYNCPYEILLLNYLWLKFYVLTNLTKKILNHAHTISPIVE
jgi:hypothetical protein